MRSAPPPGTPQVPRATSEDAARALFADRAADPWLAVDKQPVPPLEAEQGPDQQSMIHPAGDVLVKRSAHVRRLEPAAIECPCIEQDLLDVRHRRALIPRAVRRAEALLSLLDDRPGKQVSHRVAERTLAECVRVLEARRDAACHVD